MPAPRARDVPPDYDTLAEFLSALGYPVRLELLDRLRFPHTLAELSLPARRVGPGGTPGRPASKSTILAHLDKLVGADLVRTQEVPQAGRMVPSYEANAQKLYALAEDMRRLAVRYAGRGPGRDATGTLGGGPAAETARGPRLVLVHGVYEGRAYPLAPSTSQGGRWLVGRKPGLAVSLDYDPFVSLENAAVQERAGTFTLHDLPGSKNGTALNWEPLPRGGAAPLAPGDVVGVGRSLLIFRGP